MIGPVSLPDLYYNTYIHQCLIHTSQCSTKSGNGTGLEMRLAVHVHVHVHNTEAALFLRCIRATVPCPGFCAHWSAVVGV